MKGKKEKPEINNIKIEKVDITIDSTDFKGLTKPSLFKKT